MRIHSLTMTAIGPYPGTERIDFDAFGDSGRFLLTGPTGSGKTTIIDAIVFALYGSVADADDSSKDRIRSTLAGPEAESVIELVFSTSAGIYRVRRTPAYERAKKRGSGTTAQGATVKLWRLSAVGGQALDEPVTRAEDAGAEITRAVGLTREQFTQTVVLPQGKFARFLRSTSADRQELLRDVFGTGLYQRIEARLAEDSAAEHRRVEAARATLASTGASLAALPQLGAADLPEGVTEPLIASGPTPDADAMRGAARTIGEASAALAQEALRRRTAAAGAEQRASEAVEAARSTHNALERRAELLAERSALEARTQEDSARVERLAAAERAARALPAVDAADRAAIAAQDAVSALRALLEPPAEDTTAAHVAELRDRVTATAAPLLARAEAAWRRLHDEAANSAAEQAATDALGVGAPTSLEELAAALAQEEGALSALVSTEEGLAGKLAEAQALEAGMGAIRARLAAIEEELTTTRPRQEQRLRERIEAAQEASARLDGLVAAEKTATARHRAAQSVPALAKRVEEAKAGLSAATGRADEAARRVAAVRASWISSTAGALAGELRDGEACPVCGAAEHPDPAAVDGVEPTTRADIEAAEAAARKAGDALDLARREHDAAEAAHSQAVKEAEDSGPAEAATALADARAALTRARERAASLEGLREELEEHGRRAQELREEQSGLLARKVEAAERARSLRQAHADGLAACETARGPWESLASRSRDLRRAARAARETAGAVSRAENALQGADESRREARAALEAEEFAGADGVRAAALPADELASLRAAVATARAQRERVARDLAAPAIASLPEDLRDPLPAARQAHDAAAIALREAADASSRAAEAHRQVEGAASAVVTAADAYEAALGSAEALLRVADLVRGNNPAGTPLSSWVLLSRFEEVLVFANERLTEISSGRYELIRVDDESGSRAHRKGLGLAVVDHLDEHDGGHARDPKTLSGGETFYVSLALALALADVVSAESGGVGLDTLFIDEGFGALDPATLTAVMAQIDRLRAGGRTVGIVSHVAELREQIPDRITVRRLGGGASSLTVTGA
ncbi:exonuclease SbcC [Actinomyces denticolens]|uniref:Nuclease SbcCD subunit C n=1 Tax=Actinomyces denticolens TaxID=52767 RepID=A0ABY1HYU2_9ACTO|nr:SMC family ATPase [Actinomyces denticolens]SHI30023.1 exonuclease SbcC [Actinomyces denticolens]